MIWLTGLPGAGKTTIATALAERLAALGCQPYLLDGDVLRSGLNSDLGFSAADRGENARRVAEVAALLADAGLLALVALVSPYAADRNRARQRAGQAFVEVFVDCPLAVCRERDPKGLYARAAAGEVRGLTGVDDPYQPPATPEVTIDTSRQELAACVEKVLAAVRAAGLAPSRPRRHASSAASHREHR